MERLSTSVRKITGALTHSGDHHPNPKSQEQSEHVVVRVVGPTIMPKDSFSHGLVKDK